MASAPPSSEAAPFVRRIYTLHGLPPEVIAVAFAKTSRVPHAFDEIAAELSEEESSRFHEKWVIGYGHASVAEHAVLHIALENVSILATKVIEDNRLASYTEQSTRYQVYRRDRFFRPPAVMASRHAERFVALCQALMSHYWEWVEPMMAHLAPTVERPEGMSGRLWETRVRAAACDALRYLLPTATQTNLGWTVNARVLERAITKLRSHPLEEMRAIGESLREVATERVPTLLRYADPSEFLQRTPALMREHSLALTESAPLDDQWDVRLVHFDPDAEERVVAALLYEHTRASYEETLRRVRAMSPEERNRVLDDAVRHRGQHDQVGRAWETTTYTFDTLMDYGAFRDLQRHRLATQINQPISAAHGYLTPPEIVSGGFENEYRRLMDEAREVHDAMAEDLPSEAPYTVPLAYRKRTLFTMNLRELHHMIQLRTGPQGHPSYRLLSHRLLEEIRRVHPALAAQIRHTPMN
ncbi:FAD-dependent thymidylate synthase [Candidatus Sumerlaeota bacterium]|nr:FAD-dependent thymidylate synthase [Candidatus Sumerlaeota bacterium]